MGGMCLLLACILISVPDAFSAFSALSPPSDFFGQNSNSALDWSNNPSLLSNNIANNVNKNLGKNMQGIGQNLFHQSGNTGFARPKTPTNSNNRGGLGTLDSNDLKNNIDQSIRGRMNGLNPNLFRQNNKKPDVLNKNNQNSQKGTDSNHADRNSNNNGGKEDTGNPNTNQHQGSKTPQTNQRNNAPSPVNHASNSQNQGNKRNIYGQKGTTTTTTVAPVAHGNRNAQHGSNVSGNQKNTNKGGNKSGFSDTQKQANNRNNQSPKWNAGKTTRSTPRTTRKSTRRSDPREDE